MHTWDAPTLLKEGTARSIRVLAKYTKEEKQKAIDLYIRYCRQATLVIKELGYPNERHTLVSWYRGY